MPEYKVTFELLIKADKQEEALEIAEKRIGNSDYKGEDVTIEKA